MFFCVFLSITPFSLSTLMSRIISKFLQNFAILVMNWSCDVNMEYIKGLCHSANILIHYHMHVFTALSMHKDRVGRIGLKWNWVQHSNRNLICICMRMVSNCVHWCVQIWCTGTLINGMEMAITAAEVGYGLWNFSSDTFSKDLLQWWFDEIDGNSMKLWDKN